MPPSEGGRNVRKTVSSARNDSFDKLLVLIETLRSPGGCPWDMKQTRRDVGRYLIDEVYEVIEAVEEQSPECLREELGDVLFQILFLARIGEEAGEFDITGIMDGIREKMIRRHPHVFGGASVAGVDEVKENWRRIKEKEREGMNKHASLLGDIPRSLPPLAAAWHLTKKASEAGFDWESTRGVVEKIEEETKELKQALAEKGKEEISGEIGDLFFSLVNLCRFAGVHPETALASSVAKFRKRFAFIEDELKKEEKTPFDATLEEMDLLWERAKRMGI